MAPSFDFLPLELSWSTLLIPVALSVIYAIGNAIYNIFFHPLASYPGPKLWGATHVPYLYTLLTGQLPYKTAALHQKYGQVVRITPYELSFTNADAWKDIYGHRPGHPQLSKDPEFYHGFGSQGSNIIISDNKDHARFRRLLAHAFSDKALREQESLLHRYVDLLITGMRQQVQDGEKVLDMVARYNWVMFDAFGDLGFGSTFGNLEKQEYHPWVRILFGSVKSAIIARVARSYPILRDILPSLIPKSLSNERKYHEKFVENAVDRRLASQTDQKDFFSYLLRHNGDEKGMTVQEMYSNSNVLIIAGSETTATQLSGCTYYLLTNPRVLRKLQEEVRGAFETEDEITIAGVGQLKYMLAVLDESMRQYPPVPTGMPRKVGPDGDIIAGKFVPAGTTVHVGHYAAYHDPRNFHLQDEFIPERFLGDERFADDKVGVLQPFSVGARNCIGRNLAYAEMRLILAKIIWNFDMTLEERSKTWIQQSVYTLWDKPPLYVKIKARV